jgi:predicted acyl esterase
MFNGLKFYRLFYISVVMGLTPSSIFAQQDMVSQPVRIFVMGDNTWRDEQEWPIARAQYTKYYSHGQGNASALDDGTLDTRLPRKEIEDTHVYDPLNPVPTKGGNMPGGSGSYPLLAEPGEVYEYTIDLWSTSIVYKKGHRIRVDISSSDFFHFDRNPNTGNTFGMDADMHTATQTIYHSDTYPSCVELPVIPR